MNIADLIIVAVILVGLFFAGRSVIRTRKSGGCSGCSGCAHKDSCHKVSH